MVGGRGLRRRRRRSAAGERGHRRRRGTRPRSGSRPPATSESLGAVDRRAWPSWPRVATSASGAHARSVRAAAVDVARVDGGPQHYVAIDRPPGGAVRPAGLPAALAAAGRAAARVAPRAGGRRHDAPLFLPWLRRGLARGIGGADDPAGGPLPLRAPWRPIVTLVDSLGDEARCRGRAARCPGRATSRASTRPRSCGWSRPTAPPTSSRRCSRRRAGRPRPPVAAHPGAGPTASAAPLARAGLRRGARGREYDAGGPPGPVLRVAATRSRPSCPTWPSRGPGPTCSRWCRPRVVDEAVAAGTGAVTARLLAPAPARRGRRLPGRPGPRVRRGRAAGAARTTRARRDRAGVATGDGPDVELPVYVTWTFTTGAEPGDFEAAVPAPGARPRRAAAGLPRRAEVVDSGLLEPSPGDTGFEYEGALVDPASRAPARRPRPATGSRPAARPCSSDGGAARRSRGARRPATTRRSTTPWSGPRCTARGPPARTASPHGAGCRR